MRHPVLLYDGVCGLCNRTVQFVLRHDRKRIFRFAPLQSSFAARLLAQKAVNPSSFGTASLVVFDEDGEVVLERSEAVLAVLRCLGGGWSLLARTLGLIPRRLRDWVYGVVAQNRYRVFGKYDECPLPGESERERFIDI